MLNQIVSIEFKLLKNSVGVTLITKDGLYATCDITEAPTWVIAAWFNN